ncbi:alpha-hydroxy acid oxidase [Ramlibacter tataouinensis]|uniref:Candidate hydroxyacid oxidase (Glycolate oxidase) n=1 Tax=Ramlibacter tataouinensis (strain ATCC BAA-407 / DSM 14655 / LMG 21543 / TTB310) TaxID=365046 RepID=F5Y1T8_RAMTT|nr:alpha-hydroxy acid oxidase [Ramlibacter tataouinensis]AEG93522.1 Candidate hydroxyacid oxidase (Glycolate oxidase) [Ramlibacter tataouinensis TTB310]
MSAPLALQQIPPDVFSAGDYEAHARRALDANAWAYFSSHAGDGLTLRANRAAWDGLALLPRVLRPVQGLGTACTLLGREWPSPLLVAPMALQRLAHPDGELATAVAASAQGAGMVVSCEASLLLEDVAAPVRGNAGRGPLWFQLHFLPDRGAMLELVRRAEAAGYEALVVTVDAAVRAARGAEQRAGFRLPPGIARVNLPPQGPAPSDLRGLLSQAPGWDDLGWLRGQTRLPLVLKGVLHPQDACEAAALGVDAIVVSNHGGRTLDGVPATAVMLPRVADALGGRLPLLVDGGIRHGTDVLKALALGARAVLVGRPVLWALATAGAAGVAHVLRLLHDELEIVMARCGCSAPDQAGPGLLVPAPPPFPPNPNGDMT